MPRARDLSVPHLLLLADHRDLFHPRTRVGNARRHAGVTQEIAQVFYRHCRERLVIRDDRGAAKTAALRGTDKPWGALWSAAQSSRGQNHPHRGTDRPKENSTGVRHELAEGLNQSAAQTGRI